jgi:hypothetical protein
VLDANSCKVLQYSAPLGLIEHAGEGVHDKDEQQG